MSICEDVGYVCVFEGWEVDKTDEEDKEELVDYWL